ncbi:MAG: A24 family peptidase [Dehalococcoidia bacterium]|jgi:prepilin peptidase CpaA|nr:A24 family peptidase [Dehalococcoidia bacterium]
MTAVLVIGVGGGALIDCRIRRIPNTVVGATAAAGLVLALAGLTDASVPSALAGAVIGFALMLPGHLFGGTGAGDVKMFAASGAVLGVEQVPQAFVLTLIAGGVVAVWVALARGQLGLTLKRTAALVTSRGATTQARADDRSDRGFPFGPAIAAGTLLAVWI